MIFAQGVSEAKEGQCQEKGWWDKMKDDMGMGEKVQMDEHGNMIVMSATRLATSALAFATMALTIY